MKKTTFILTLSIALLALCFEANAQKRYEDKECGAITAQHKKIAILPFVISYQMKQTKNMSAEINQKQMDAQAYLLQNQLYAAMLTRSEKLKYNVEIQNIDETNSILQKAKIAVSDLPSTPKEKVAKFLAVDAVICGILSGKQLFTEGEAAAIKLIGTLSNSSTYTTTNECNIDVSLLNSVDGKLLWKYNGNYTGSSIDDMAGNAFYSVSRQIPYSEKWRKRDEKNKN